MSDDLVTETRQRCQYCGDDLLDGIVPLDIEIVDPETGDPDGYHARYHMCSERCRDKAVKDKQWMLNDEITHRATVSESEVNHV